MVKRRGGRAIWTPREVKYFKSRHKRIYHREQRSPIWPYFQLNSLYNCSANRSVFVSSHCTVYMKSCYASVEILSAAMVVALRVTIQERNAKYREGKKILYCSPLRSRFKGCHATLPQKRLRRRLPLVICFVSRIGFQQTRNTIACTQYSDSNQQTADRRCNIVWWINWNTVK